jgi:hypothetical protein
LVPLSRALHAARDALAAQDLPFDLAARVQRSCAACAASAASAPQPVDLRLPAALVLPSALPAGPTAPVGKGSRGLPWPRWQAAWAAGLCLTVLAAAWGWFASSPVASFTQAAAGSVGSGFLPVVSVQRLQELADEDAGPTWLVPGEWPRERLAAFGLPYDPARAGETVRAELLVHDSGDVLAVRLLGP